MRSFAILVVFGVVLYACDPTRASPSRVRRQGWAWGGDDDDSGDLPVGPNLLPTAPPTPLPPPIPPTGNDGNVGGNPGNLDPNASTTTVAPLAYTRCFNACPATQQYNPVCGTNRVTYNNAGMLNCARQCGVDVQVMFGGTCAPVTR